MGYPFLFQILESRDPRAVFFINMPERISTIHVFHVVMELLIIIISLLEPNSSAFEPLEAFFS